MAIALRSSNENWDSGAVTDHTVNAPAGAASGDVLLGFWYTGDGTSWAAPSGWSSLLSVNDASFGSFLLARKVLSGSPAASYTAVSSSWVAAWGNITAWTGVDGTTPEDVAADYDSQDTSFDAPSLTIATAGAVMVCYYAEGADENPVPDALQTLIDDGNGVPTYLASYETRASTGATGVRTATEINNRAQCISAALRPAAAAAGRVPNAIMLLGVG